MLNSRIIDNTNNCNIIKHSLCDDLLPYTYDGNKMIFDDNTDARLIFNTALDVMVAASNSTDYKEVWQPLFISNDNYVENKLLSSYGSCHNSNPQLKSGRLGIENIINFIPKFKSWNTTQGRMCVDWFLNGTNTPYSVYYGVMCWFRFKDTTNPSVSEGLAKPLDYFPNGARIVKSTDQSIIYIKLDNNTLYMVNNSSKKLENGAWTFSEESEIIDVSSLGKNVLFNLSSSYFEEQNNKSVFCDSDLLYKLWIPDGDCFFYHNNEEEKNRALLKGIGCKSYVSSSLYQKYSSIYRILTIDHKRSFESKDLKMSRYFKKLAHVLSTSPFIDHFSIEALDSEQIRTIIQDSFNKTFNSIEDEILEFKKVLLDISRFLQNTTTDTTNSSLFLDTKLSSRTLNNNLITNKTQLLSKLLSKYGAYLKISGTSNISANTDKLKFDNSGIVITQVIDSYCDKNLINTPVHNSEKIVFDSTTIETELNEYNSNIDIFVENKLKNTIPLYDAGKPLFDNTSFCPSLVYKGEVPTKYRKNGPYNEESNTSNYLYLTPIDDFVETTLVTNPTNQHCAFLNNNGIQLKALDILTKDQSYNEPSLLLLENYIISQNSFLWEQISGPEGTFDKDSSFQGLTNEVVFYAKYTGKYVLQCTISSPFGIFKRQRTIYVVDGRELVPDGNPNGNMKDNKETYLKYWNPETKEWLSPPADQSIDLITESKPLILDKDKNKSTIAKINKIAISNYHGVVWPIKTDFSVREYIGSFGINSQDEVYTLSKDYLFNYDIDYIYKTESNLSLIFNAYNTVIKIYSIYLEKIRTDKDNCAQCLSLYFPKLRSFKQYLRRSSGDGNTSTDYNFNRIIRTNKHPEGFTLRSYKWNTTRNLAECDPSRGEFRYKQISTNKGPKIKSYGGYSKGFVDSLGLEIEGLPKPKQSINDIGIVASNSAVSTLPSVTGFPLNYRNDSDRSTYKVCYQKAIMPTGTGLILSFNKGVFHPSSGWIVYSGGSDYAIHANRCGILKFNPGARDSFTFVGPQINKIKSGFIDIANNKINSKIYSSSITLSIAPEIQWDPACSCSPVTPAQNIELYNNNQKHKDYIDTKTTNNNSNHGYRILAGGQPKPIEPTATTNYPLINDEFLTNQTTNNFSYSFAVTGPHSVPEKVMLPDGRMQFRIPRVNGFGIKDIEVKLNFLNYVNTKNLAVWLDVEYSTGENASRFSSPTISTPLKSNTEFLDQTADPGISFGQYRKNQILIKDSLNNNNIEQYLIDLLKMNSSSSVSSSNFKLFLLNQEPIQNNGYNFSVKFSDNAPKTNVPCDMNIMGSGYVKNESDYYYTSSHLYRLQNIIRSNDELLPTVAVTGYSDREWCEYSSIIRNNKLNITSNTFSKFVADTLFRNEAPKSGPCGSERAPKQQEGDLNGFTTFTLNIMVLDEEDDMSVLDSTVNNQYISGLETTETKSKSHLLYNSLCNWELILHVGSVRDPLPHTNPNLASYGNNDVLSLIDYKKDPSYPGYTFIADLSNFKHLLPLANYNAPYSCIADSTLCLTSQDDPTGQGVMVRPPDFPSYAIVQILAGLAAYGGMTGGTLVGALAGLESAVNNPAYGALFDYFRESRFTEELENQGRQIYSPGYSKYPFGSPEKILINFKKPDSLWYTTEATIFKYHNTPILKPKKYKFLKLTEQTQKDTINEFKFDIVSSFKDIVDEKFIKTIKIENCDKKYIPSGIVTPSIYNDVLINDGDIVDTTAICSDKVVSSETYVVQNNNQWVNLKNISNLNKATHYLQHNNILSINNNLTQSDIKDKKTALIYGRIPYDIFKKDDIVELASTNKKQQATIVKKGLIFKNNQYYSLLVLDKDISIYEKIVPSNDMNIFLVYKDQTTIQDNQALKYNIWGIESSDNVFSNTADIAITTHSVGSYGDLSPFVNKNLLSNNIHNNKLQSIYDIFNNKDNDKIKHNKVKLFYKPLPTSIILTELSGFTSSTSYGFCYSKNDLKMDDIFRKDVKNKTFINTSEIDNNLIRSIEFSSAYNEIPNNFSILRLDNNNQNNVVPSSIIVGELEIENDYYESKPSATISTDELLWLVNRLNTIESIDSDPALEAIIGDKTKTSQIINSGKLKYLNNHYVVLPDDPVDCDLISVINKDLCYKKKTYTEIQRLYEERNNIIRLLDEQTIKDNTATNPSGYKLKSMLPDTDPRRMPLSVLPKIKPIISGINWNGKNTGPYAGPIQISYDTINTDSYWINIDPKQSCFQDFESNPKVLISTTYKCKEANPVLGMTTSYADNNICPYFTTKAEHRIQFGSGNNENILSDVDEYKYTINSSIINNQKLTFQTQYPAITGWKQFEKKRWFNINGDQTMDNILDSGAEITVESTELYWVPLVNENQGNDQSGDTSILSGIPPCQTNIGSPAGRGLITTSNTRVGKPTRVCNVVNLDNTNDISVKIKKIPRLLRGVDLLSTVYRYGSKSEFRPTSFTKPPVPFETDFSELYGNINNSIYVWTAFQRNNTSMQLEPASLPEFFKLQNEMIFRSFFGSVDKIENKSDASVSNFPWELIPYEYDS